MGCHRAPGPPETGGDCCTGIAGFACCTGQAGRPWAGGGQRCAGCRLWVEAQSGCCRNRLWCLVPLAACGLPLVVPRFHGCCTCLLSRYLCFLISPCLQTASRLWRCLWPIRVGIGSVCVGLEPLAGNWRGGRPRFVPACVGPGGCGGRAVLFG